MKDLFNSVKYCNNTIWSCFKTKWLLLTGILLVCAEGMAQRNNVWLLRSYLSYNKNREYSYCLDFNYCPPRYHYIYLENDIYWREKHTKYHSSKIFVNSFCDTTGQFAFTELLGQHYYNKLGKIYDSSYIQNKYDRFFDAYFGASISANNNTYYFKAFQPIDYRTDGPSWSPNWQDSDSIIICVSEFDNAGNLLKKNIPVYSLYSADFFPYSVRLFKACKIDEETVELILSFNGKVSNNVCLNYNLKNGKISTKESLDLDFISDLKYSTNKNKIGVTRKGVNNVSIVFYSRKGISDYTNIGSIDIHKYPAQSSKLKFYYLNDYCFSSNDSILYAIVIYQDTTLTNKPVSQFLLAINYYKPYSDYKFITLPNTGNYYYLKLGPDGNVYINAGAKTKGNFRVIHPNNMQGFKLERLPDVDDGGSNFTNFALGISTLEEYKKTEFVWQPICDSLKVRFNNTCDTEHFKLYRLFFDNGDSIDLNKNWNTAIYNYTKAGKYYVRLKAFSKGGGFIWYGDSIEINSPPIAKFDIQKTEGCQWVGYGFIDSSRLFNIKSGFKPYKRWFFGDGKDSINASTNPKLNYTYTSSDTFTVQLVVNNGYCTDTATQINNVLIQPAPKPGIITSPLSGCTPLKVTFNYKYNDVLDSAVWRSGSLEKAKGITGSFTYNQIGYFFLSQKLYGPSGCITTDSVLIKVNPGISGMPDILSATVVNENSIDLKWKKHLNAVSYSIIKNNNFLTRTTDTSYTDKSANTLMPNSYTIKAISICNDSTNQQDVAQTIYLQANRTDDNEAQLNWTAYQRWDAGVNTYQLFTQNEAGYFELLATLNGQTLEYLDESFAGISEPQKCYKIIADEREGNLQQSVSNIYCLPLKPVLIIPSAFSPNGDGVNDTWKISYKGIKEANIKIFNRWGEVIYLARGETEKIQWDAIYKGLPVPVGTYFYQIEATGIKAGKVYKNGLVEVVR